MGKKRERREKKAAALAGITTYDADGDRRRRHCPCGAAADVDMMMTMAGERGGEATARQRRGEYKATTRQKVCEGNRLWRRRWQGQRGNQQEDNKYINR